MQATKWRGTKSFDRLWMGEPQQRTRRSQEIIR